MLAYLLYAILSGYALFLLGFAVFMYFENRKFGDNQFTMKLLPPPPRLISQEAAVAAALAEAREPVSDWTPAPDRSRTPAYPESPARPAWARAA